MQQPADKEESKGIAQDEYDLAKRTQALQIPLIKVEQHPVDDDLEAYYELLNRSKELEEKKQAADLLLVE